MSVSTRFVRHVAVLALLAGGVVWTAWLSPDRADPCAHPDVLSVTGLIPGTRPEGERRERLGGNIVQWSEGHIPDPNQPSEPLLFRIVRSYSVLKAAEHPLALLPNQVEPETIRVEQVEAPGGPLPVHVVRTTGATRFHVVVYLFVLGNDPVVHPFAAQLRGAFRDLTEGPRPLTVILAGGSSTKENAGAREELAVGWIVSAWQHYRAMCIARPRPSAVSAQ